LAIACAACNGSDAVDGDLDDMENAEDEFIEDSDYTELDLDTSSTIWTDTASGLSWRRNINPERLSWEDAKKYCDSLEWYGNDWRLPSISELRSLVRGCPTIEYGGACWVYDQCPSHLECEADNNDPEVNVCSGLYNCRVADKNENEGYCPPEINSVGKLYPTTWSSTEDGDYAFVIDFYRGLLTGYFKNTDTYKYWALCVTGTFIPPEPDGDEDDDTDSITQVKSYWDTRRNDAICVRGEFLDQQK